MPVSASGRVFRDGKSIITAVYLTTEIDATVAGTIGQYTDFSIQQFSAAGIEDDAELNELVGQHIDPSTRAVTAYTPTGADLRLLRRNRIDGLVREAMLSIPPVASGKETAANSAIHRFLRMIVSASRVDANMDDNTRFNHVEDAAKGGSLTGGMRAFFKALSVGTTSYTNGWTAAMADTVTELVTVDSSGNHTGTTATLPTNWHTAVDYDPIQAF